MSARHLVVQYLYVHGGEESFSYPNTRAGGSAADVAIRYLECALTQAASLRLQNAPCELALATNLRDRRALGDTGAQLIAALEAFDVHLLHADYLHRPPAGTDQYAASRYLLDAVFAATAGQPADRTIWLTDMDCVWVDPARVFDAAPEPPELGCIYLGYPPEWDAVGHGEHGQTRAAIGELAARLGVPSQQPPWVGGELLCGTPITLRILAKACEELDATLAEQDVFLPNEEQILTLAGAAGHVAFRDLSPVARRVPTGPRNGAAKVDRPESVGLWHLPSEKGLSLRRTARELLQGREIPLREDLADAKRAARRFNVAGGGLHRRIEDDGWLTLQRIRTKIVALRRRTGGYAKP
jgi:hypothetical protein